LAKNGGERATLERLVQRDRNTEPIALVSQHSVASFRPDVRKTNLLKSLDCLRAGNHRKTSHATFTWTGAVTG